MLAVPQRSAIPLPEQTVLRQYPPNVRYLVGVSGGRDSLTLLHWLVSGGYRNLVVCHLNHQLRGRASVADARFVEKVAAKLGLIAVIGKTDVNKLAGAQKLSIEAAAPEVPAVAPGRRA